MKPKTKNSTGLPPRRRKLGISGSVPDFHGGAVKFDRLCDRNVIVTNLAEAGADDIEIDGACCVPWSDSRGSHMAKGIAVKTKQRGTVFVAVIYDDHASAPQVACNREAIRKVALAQGYHDVDVVYHSHIKTGPRLARAETLLFGASHPRPSTIVAARKFLRLHGPLSLGNLMTQGLARAELLGMALCGDVALSGGLITTSTIVTLVD
jgi:hypothetical protein